MGGWVSEEELAAPYGLLMCRQVRATAWRPCCSLGSPTLCLQLNHCWGASQHTTTSAAEAAAGCTAEARPAAVQVMDRWPGLIPDVDMMLFTDDIPPVRLIFSPVCGI